MHHKAYKSSCPALASCSSGNCAGRCPPKHGQGGVDVSGCWAQGWCSSKPAEVYTFDKQPDPHLHPAVTTADAAPSCASFQCSQSWAPNVNSAPVIWLYTIYPLYTLKSPTGAQAVLGSSALGASSHSWVDSLPTEYFWSGSLLVEITSLKIIYKTSSFQLPFQIYKRT